MKKSVKLSSKNSYARDETEERGSGSDAAAPDATSSSDGGGDDGGNGSCGGPWRPRSTQLIRTATSVMRSNQTLSTTKMSASRTGCSTGRHPKQLEYRYCRPESPAVPRRVRPQKMGKALAPQGPLTMGTAHAQERRERRGGRQ